MSNRKKKKNIIKLAGIIFVILVSVICFKGKVISAAGTSKPSDNMYAVTINNGVNEIKASQIRYIAMSYIDEDGVSRTEYGFTADKLKDSAGIMAEKGQPFNANLAVLKNYGNSIQSWENNEELIGKFGKYSAKTLIFEPEFKVKKVEGIQIVGTSGTTWSIQDLRVYKIDELYGLRVSGTVSSDYFADFKGTLLKSLEADSVTMNFSVHRVYNFSDEKGSFKLVDKNEKYDTSDKYNYAIKMDIADIYGAGIESFATEYDAGKATLRSLCLPEAINANIKYKDIYGNKRETNIPVILSTIAMAEINGVDMDAPIAELAGQGDSLVFGGAIPDFAEAESINLSFNSEEARSINHITMDNGKSVSKANSLAYKNETLSVTGLSIYDINDGNITITPYIENSVLKYSFRHAGTKVDEDVSEDEDNAIYSPAYFHTASMYTGEAIQYADKNVHAVQMTKYDNKQLLEPVRSLNDLYLVELYTDDVPSAGTTDDLYVSLGYYDVAGQQGATSEQSIRTLTRDFYGYWPCSDSAVDEKGSKIYGEGDFAYLAGASASKKANGDYAGQQNKLTFIMSIPNVSYFTKATLKLEGNDDYQASGIRIYKIQSLEKRFATWNESPLEVAGLKTNLKYDRNFEGKLLMALESDLLLQGGQIRSYEFESGSVVEDEDEAWNIDTRSMTFEQCNKNFGFNKKRSTYDVEVKVASDSKASDTYGDTGSKNQFYFRLIFKNGTSAYVLANQQLSADGFRAGMLESFSIAVNNDYGDLQAVQIIPDDTSDDSAIYDKMNVDYIRVSKKSSKSVTKQWKIENVGWTNIDYRDDGEKGKESGRQTSSLAKTYQVTATGYKVNLLFCISTGDYEEYQQYRGSMRGELQYTNGQGEICTKSFDMVEAMAEYANKTVSYDEKKDTNGNITKYAQSDPSYMFRANHTDRFIISVDDVSKVNSLTVYPTSTNGTMWKHCGVTVMVANSDGYLVLDDNDEYKRTGNPQAVCTSTTDQYPAMFCPKNEEQSRTIYFGDNDLKIVNEESAWVSTVSREPDSKDDKLNIYVYPSDNQYTEYKMNATIKYTDVYGSTYQVAAKDMYVGTDGDGQAVLYKNGVSAQALSVINSVNLRATETTSVARVNHVVIERVRGGTVIDTYYMDCNDIGTSYGMKIEPKKYVSETEYQELSLMFGSNTATEVLNAEKHDIAVGIVYTTKLDPLETQYSSKNVFLTDDQIESIAAGKVVKIRFDEPYLKDIKAIKLFNVGNVKATFGGAVVAKYMNTADDNSCTGWYSIIGSDNAGQNTPFNENDPIDSNKIIPVSSTDSTSLNSLSLIDMTLVTAKAEDNVSAGTASKLRATIGYTTLSDSVNVKEEVITDVSRYITSGSLEAGKEANIRFMLKDFRELRWIKIEPLNENISSITSWHGDSLTFRINNGTEKVLSAKIGKTAYAGTPVTINMSSIVVGATAQIFDKNNKLSDSKFMRMGELNMMLIKGDRMEITPEISGSAQGCEIRLELIDSSSSATRAIDINSSDSAVTVGRDGKIEVVESKLNTGTYCLTISSKEAAEAKVMIKFTVSSAETETTTTAPPVTTTIPETTTTEPVQPSTTPTPDTQIPAESTTPQETTMSPESKDENQDT